MPRCKTRKFSEQKPHIKYDLTSLQEAESKVQFFCPTYPSSGTKALGGGSLINFKNGFKVLTGRLRTCGSICSWSIWVIFPTYAGLINQKIQSKIHGKDRRFFNKKVSDHFAIIPTGELPSTSLGSDEAKDFDLVVQNRMQHSCQWLNGKMLIVYLCWVT